MCLSFLKICHIYWVYFFNRMNFRNCNLYCVFGFVVIHTVQLNYINMHMLSADMLLEWQHSCRELCTNVLSLFQVILIFHGGSFIQELHPVVVYSGWLDVVMYMQFQCVSWITDCFTPAGRMVSVPFVCICKSKWSSTVEYYINLTNHVDCWPLLCNWTTCNTGMTLIYVH